MYKRGRDQYQKLVHILVNFFTCDLPEKQN